MARISLGICLMFVIASSVIYEAQGHFLLKHFLRKNFPRKSNEFTPFANKGMLMFVTDLESTCPPTTEFKTFFTQYKSYMTFIESASTSSQSVDAEMTAKCDGLFKAMSALSVDKGTKSMDAGSMKATILSMGKTLLAQKKKAIVMTVTQKKELVLAMVKWTRMLATFVKSASEKKGKTINIASYGLDVNVNDKSIYGESSSSSKTVSGSTTKTGAFSGTKTKGFSGVNSETTKISPSNSPSVGGKASLKESTSAKEGVSPKGNVNGGSNFEARRSSRTSSQMKQSSRSSYKMSYSSSVKQVESQTSKQAMSFIMQLEKKYGAKTELKAFFEKLKASMEASSSIASKTAKDYVSSSKAATGQLSEAMALVGSRYSKSAKMKSNMETCQDDLMKTLKQLQDINSQIATSKKVTSTQQTELKQTITKWEKVTTQFVETATSSSSSQQSMGMKSRMVKTN
ncbi:hypothetical protein V5N11_013348 [Cardamine amara subsp. amara]|uniref:DUF1216 domain-containing protein n=1 Tax=Cardamine amara subsp. amara TaxID=228776 RepID=A0ABD1BKQ3_CARAN